MARLMDFMYTGATEARQEELPEFLTTATKLQIRGFGFRRLTDEENDQKKAFNGCFDEGRFPKYSARKKICGRKHQFPKSLNYLKIKSQFLLINKKSNMTLLSILLTRKNFQSWDRILATVLSKVLTKFYL